MMVRTAQNLIGDARQSKSPTEDLLMLLKPGPRSIYQTLSLRGIVTWPRLACKVFLQGVASTFGSIAESSLPR